MSSKEQIAKHKAKVIGKMRMSDRRSSISLCCSHAYSTKVQHTRLLVWFKQNSWTATTLPVRVPNPQQHAMKTVKSSHTYR